MKDSCIAPHQNYLSARIKGSDKFHSAGLSGNRFCGPLASAEKQCGFLDFVFQRADL